MDDLDKALAGGGSGAKNQSLEKAMFDPNANQQYRKKLKMPEPDKVSEEVKSECHEMNYRRINQNHIGQFYYLTFIQQIQPAQGTWLLALNRYMRMKGDNRKPTAQHLLDTFVSTIDEIFSSPDASTSVQAYQDGGIDGLQQASQRRASAVATRRSSAAGKPSRAAEKATKLREANTLHEELTEKLSKKGATFDLFREAKEAVEYEVDKFVGCFKNSPQFTLWCQARMLEQHHVEEDDFHQFRVLGVGGFGSVNAALKKDTGALFAIKRMDKKLIKHKNRYKSCAIEVDALKHLKSRFICGLHYTYATKDEVSSCSIFCTAGRCRICSTRRRRSPKSTCASSPLA